LKSVRRPWRLLFTKGTSSTVIHTTDATRSISLGAFLQRLGIQDSHFFPIDIWTGRVGLDMVDDALAQD
jgi:hypothetical protein